MNLRQLRYRANALLMLTCKEMCRLSSDELENPTLKWSIKWRQKLHLLVCPWCRRYRNQLKFVRKAVSILAESPAAAVAETAPASFKQQIQETLKSIDNSSSK